jgi:hypothetical protein
MEEALREIEELHKRWGADAPDGFPDLAAEAARDFVETYGHALLEIAREHLKF